jgi:hypothetical protein
MQQKKTPRQVTAGQVPVHSEGFGFQFATSFFAFAIWSGVILLATLSRYCIA